MEQFKQYKGEELDLNTFVTVSLAKLRAKEMVPLLKEVYGQKLIDPCYIRDNSYQYCLWKVGAEISPSDPLVKVVQCESNS